jgi:hypothetical protein
MSDDDTTDETAPVDGTPDDRTTSDADRASKPDRDGVHIPQWLAGALVVVLALAVGGTGFAIGRATDDGHGGRPEIAGVRGGGPGGQGNPGGPPGLGGQGPQRPGLERGEDGGGRPGAPGSQDDGGDESDSGGGGDGPAGF